jgi:MoxR-like ATPase
MPILPTDLKNDTRMPSEPVQLAPSRKLDLRDPSGYKPDDDLVDAIKVALLLRKPLLVTGEPGTGKTDLGRYLAWKSRFLFFQFEAKSNSISRDLYYRYDSLGRFQATQSGEKTEGRSFLQFDALGEAILQSLAMDELGDRVRGLLPVDFKHQGPRQSVVVIDEIDKAPRDFPNDLLNELDRHFFRMPEFGVQRITAGEGLEPVLVITSNSEKNLPAAFLRRCVYYNIEFPKDTEPLRQIVASRIVEFGGETTPLLSSALELFELLRRDAAGLGKKPATAELLDWMLLLLALGADRKANLRSRSSLSLVKASLPALIKRALDRPAALDEVEKWIGGN